MRSVFGSAIAATTCLCAVMAAAQSPLTPVRPLASPGAAAQWVEPPPGDKPAASGSAAASASVAATADAPEAQTQPAKPEARVTRHSARRSGGSTADRLNHQELARIRSGTGAAYYPASPIWPFRLF